MGVNLAMTPTRAWAKFGERAVGKRPGNRGSNISVIGAVGIDDVKGWYPYDGAIDGERFIGFMKTRIVTALKPGDHVVMDNVRFHHIAPVRQIIEATGAMLTYLPPYSPELNPIEEVFSVVKSKIKRSQPRDIPQLVQALEDAWASVTRGKLVGFFLHALLQPA